MKTGKVLLGGLFSVLALTLVSLIPVHTADAVTYNAGVAVGNSFTYQFSASSNTGNSLFSGVQGVNAATVQITKVSGPRVNGTLTYTFTNGTVSKTSFLQGDLSSGGGNLTFILIPAGLNGGDSFPFMGSIVTLNSSSTVSVLGVSRTVDFLNYSLSGGGYFFREGLAWDKLTGALLGVNFNESISSPPSHGSFQVLLTGTNVWSSSILGLPPAIFYAIIGVMVIAVVVYAVVYLTKGGRPAAAPSALPPATQTPPNP